MRKTFTKIAGCAALGLLMCFNAPAITKAAVKQFLPKTEFTMQKLI